MAARLLLIAAAVQVSAQSTVGSIDDYDVENTGLSNWDEGGLEEGDSGFPFTTFTITDTQKFGEIAAQFVPDAITHLDQTFEYYRQCGAKCLDPEDPTTANTRKETEYVRDQWDIFSYAYPAEPQIGGSDPWPTFRLLIGSLHKDIGDIKDLKGKAGKKKKLARLSDKVMVSIRRYHDIATNREWIDYFQNPATDKLYHRTEEMRMSRLVWGGRVQYWFGPNTNRPVPTVRLTGKQNLAALMQLELFKLQSFYMDVMTADLTNITTISDLYEVKEAIHDTRKEIRIVSHQIKQFPEVFTNASLAETQDAGIHRFYADVFTPVLEKLRLWEKANTHHAASSVEEKTKKDFLAAVDNLHQTQEALPPEERFAGHLERTRANVIPVTVPQDPSWSGTEIVNPPPTHYWPLYLGVGLPIGLAVILVISYFYQRSQGFGQNSYQYLEDYGRRET